MSCIAAAHVREGLSYAGFARSLLQVRQARGGQGAQSHTVRGDVLMYSGAACCPSLKAQADYTGVVEGVGDRNGGLWEKAA